eukprot:Nk52_evm20s2356 gene=Nk52_evmTU20s2356
MSGLRLVLSSVGCKLAQAQIGASSAALGGNGVALPRFFGALSGSSRRMYCEKGATGAGEKAEETKTAEETTKGKEESKTGEADLKAQFEKLKHEHKVMEENYNEMKDKYLRSLADNENVRHRAEVQVKNAKEFGNQKFAKDLIDVSDVLTLAIKSTPEEQLKADNKPLKDLYEGIVMTEHNLQKVFKSHGLVQFDPIDEPFDPNHHEARFEVDDPSKDPMTVAVVVKTGYHLHSRVLRAAEVGVVRKRS